MKTVKSRLVLNLCAPPFRCHSVSVQSHCSDNSTCVWTFNGTRKRARISEFHPNPCPA